MAKKLTDFDDFKRGRSSSLKWGQFDTGDTWELVAGEDYTTSTKAAMDSVRNWGKARGRKVTIRQYEDRFVFRITSQDAKA